MYVNTFGLYAYKIFCTIARTVFNIYSIYLCRVTVFYRRYRRNYLDHYFNNCAYSRNRYGSTNVVEHRDVDHRAFLSRPVNSYIRLHFYLTSRLYSEERFVTGVQSEHIGSKLIRYSVLAALLSSTRLSTPKRSANAS